MKDSRTMTIKGAEFKTLDNAGHAVFLDQPERFHDLLADFVKRCS
jgi:pimeloyl-ACP methyl ester carboxylesterase